MIYELREYHPMPGKRAALLQRFEKTALRLFERHGIRVAGFWEEAVGTEGLVVYLCAYDDHDARSRAWAAFRADAEWQAAREETERDGPLVARIVNRLWDPIAFAPQP